MLRLPESQLKNRLVMRVDKLKRLISDKVVAISRAITGHSRLRWTLEQWATGNQATVARERKALANVTIKRRKHVQGAETRITLQQTVFTLARRAENVERSVIWQVCVDLLELLSPRPRVVARRAREAKVQIQPILVGTAARMATCHLSVPRRRCMRWKSPPLQVRWQSGYNRGWTDRKLHRHWQREWRDP